MPPPTVRTCAVRAPLCKACLPCLESQLFFLECLFAPLQGLFAFLEGDVERQLRRVYPVQPQRADSWLGAEIARAARDPGALGVFRWGWRADSWAGGLGVGAGGTGAVGIFMWGWAGHWRLRPAEAGP